MKRLKLHALLIVAILAISTTFAQKAPVGPMLYNQMNNPNTEYPNTMYSYQAIDDENKDKTTFTADDFTVPAGETWNVAFIDVMGKVDNYATSPDITTVNVFIYENATENMPGSAEVYSGTDITAVSYYGNGNFLIELPTAVSLSEGTYWLCVQPVRTHATDGYWKWETQQTGNNGAPFFYKNPQLGFSYDAEDWTSGSDIFGFWESYDMSFALHGPRLTNDLAMVDLLSPASGPSLDQGTVTVQIENRGLEAQTAFDVRYKINENSWITETATDLTIEPGQLGEYTFAATADLSEVATHTIATETALANDENIENDGQSFEVTNFGNVFVMGEFDQITTCSGGFTDPGGPTGSWEGEHDYVATIYPDTENARVRLVFKDFDNSWTQFYIYDGETVDAPTIDLTPDNDNTEYAYDTDIVDTVTASNSAGALTIAWSANNGSAPGWFADISCWTPPADDFAITDLQFSIPTIFEGQNIEVTATVYNAGLTEQAKDVTFTLNGEVYETVTSEAIAASESTSVSVNWTPQTGGEFSFTASVPEDDGETNNNTMEVSVSVYSDGDLVESFEGNTFPPEFWSRTNQRFSQDSDPGNPYVEGESYAQTYSQDTLVTPRLIINDGDQLEFLAFSAPWWFVTLDLFYSETPNGPWTHIQNVPLDPMTNYFQEFSIDISAAAGNNYIAFATGAPEVEGFGISMNIDFVRGPQIFYYDHNITASGLNGDVSPLQYETISYTVNVKNNGLVDLEANSYSVKLMIEDAIQGDQELVTISGEALASKETMQYTFDYAFNQIGASTIYGLVTYDDDMDMTDNATRPVEIFVQAAGTDTVQVGNAEAYSWDGYPFNGYSNSEVTQTLYMDYEIGSTGTITGLTYFYANEQAADIDDLPIQIYLAETTDINMETGLRSSEEFTLVYNDTISIEALSEGELFFPFEMPFVYNGDNLIVLTYREESETGGQVLFQGEADEIPNRSARVQYLYGAVDLTDAETLNAHYSLAVNNMLPNTVFHKNESGIGQIEGMVFDESGQGANDVLVELTGTSASTTTNEFGQFQFLVAPEGEHTLKITKFGYRDVLEPIDVLSGAATSALVNLELKPNVTLTGRVLTSDNNTPVSDLPVTLDGYDQYTVTTDADGYFTVNSMYANETYALTINLEHYATYTADIEVPEGANINLGNIILDEIEEPSFMVQATETDAGMELTWQKPYTSVSDSISLFNEQGFYTGYAADVNEEVWMGNKFEIGQDATLTGFDMIIYNWAEGGYSEGDVMLEIFDMNEDLMMTQQFTIPIVEGETYYPVHVDIPDVTFENGFYVMIHWQGLDYSTPLSNTPLKSLVQIIGKGLERP
ncbi:MAG: carboxypeptidase regulatory-like domain-containing protein, partial [Salinivirgaceae bacterium]